MEGPCRSWGATQSAGTSSLKFIPLLCGAEPLYIACARRQGRAGPPRAPREGGDTGHSLGPCITIIGGTRGTAPATGWGAGWPHGGVPHPRLCACCRVMSSPPHAFPLGAPPGNQILHTPSNTGTGGWEPAMCPPAGTGTGGSRLPRLPRGKGKPPPPAPACPWRWEGPRPLPAPPAAGLEAAGLGRPAKASTPSLGPP